MQSLLGGVAEEQKRKSVDSAQGRVDSFRSTYVGKETMSNSEVRTEIKKKIAKDPNNPSKIKEKLSDRDLQGVLSDIDAAEGK